MPFTRLHIVLQSHAAFVAGVKVDTINTNNEKQPEIAKNIVSM